MPPEAAAAMGPNVPDRTVPPAVSVRLDTITKRRDFLSAARAKRAGQPGLLLQARERENENDDQKIRVGFTCSKKIGNAVTRNRAKRRLREIARVVLPDTGHAGWDYVLVGRPKETVSRPYEELLTDLRRALKKVHA